MSTVVLAAASSSPMNPANPSVVRMSGTTMRATATPARYSAPASAHASTGTGPQTFGGLERIQPSARSASPITPNAIQASNAKSDGTFTARASDQSGTLVR